ncbi:hypothetical protein HYZ98_00655 [Candidatus Peregrinibacteria bacterium]|nr:hypothetical protein [Candidatus Peregrinibacteria bacterium]
MSNIDLSFEDMALEGEGNILSIEEFLAELEREERAADEAEFTGMSCYERERIKKGRIETICRQSCKDLRVLLIERRKALLAALCKPILFPASFIGALIAAAAARGDIGPIVAGIGVAVDIGGMAWLFNSTRKKVSMMNTHIHRCRRVIQGYREQYGREVEWILAEEHLDSENDIF